MPEQVRLPEIYARLPVMARLHHRGGYRGFREAALERRVPGAYQENSLWYGDPSRKADIIAAVPLKKLSDAPIAQDDQPQEHTIRPAS